MADSFPFADIALARRLERAEARANASYVATRARLFPDRGARWIDVNGTYAMFDGVDSPVTQTFGFGLFAAPSAEDLDVLEHFFEERGAIAHHEVSPLADPEHAPLLSARGYEPFEFTSVLYQPIAARTTAAPAPGIRVRRVDRTEQEVWGRTSAAGWSETPGLEDFLLENSRMTAERDDAVMFLAEHDERPIATGALCISDGVALLAGASTIPEGRHRGAQLALLASRLSYAAQCGCDLAMIGALPGSGSQRNAERNGFRIAYTRAKWRRVPSRVHAPGV